MSNKRLLSQINVTPFVDVMLVLLVIFMVTAPMMEAGIDVKLPATDAGAVEAPQEPVTVTIDKSGNVYVNNALTERGTSFKKKLAEALGSRKEKVVYLKADESVNYGIVASVMADIRKFGIDRIAMITESAPSPKENN